MVMFRTRRRWVSALITICLILIAAVPAAAQSSDPYYEGDKQGSQYARNTVSPEEAGLIVPEDEGIKKVKQKKKSAEEQGVSLMRAYADGRVYDVFDGPLNVRSCASLNCTVVRVAYTGADLLNDRSAGTISANGYTWVKVVYGFSSSDPCTNGTQYKGWVVVDFLNGGFPYVVDGPVNVRTGGSCSSSVITSTWNSGGFYDSADQWVGKWYAVYNPNCPFTCNEAYIQGWDFVDVY